MSIFTSESVSEGHPIKLLTKFDALIDNFLAFDARSKVVGTPGGKLFF